MGQSYSCADPTDDVLVAPPPTSSSLPSQSTDGASHPSRPHSCEGRQDRQSAAQNLDAYTACRTRTHAVSTASTNNNSPTRTARTAQGGGTPDAMNEMNYYPPPPPRDIHEGSRRDRRSRNQNMSRYGRTIAKRLGLGSRAARSGECSHRYDPDADRYQHSDDVRYHEATSASSHKLRMSNYLSRSGRGGSRRRGEEMDDNDKRLDESLMGGLMESAGGGIINFLSVTGEREVGTPDRCSNSGEGDGHNNGEEGGSRSGSGGKKTRMKLFYRDPLDLEQFGMDVTDEATVAGRQIYAARIRGGDNADRGTSDVDRDAKDGSDVGNDSPSGVGCDMTLVDDNVALDANANPTAESRTISRTGSTGSMSRPHPADLADETSLLLPQSADAARSTVTNSTKKRGRVRLFPRMMTNRNSSRARAKKNDSYQKCQHQICNEVGGGDCCCCCRRLYDDDRDDTCSRDGLRASSYGDAKYRQGHHLHHYLCPVAAGQSSRFEDVPPYPRGCASFLFSREAVRNNTADAVEDMVCVDADHKIYVADIGLSDKDCQSIINVAERCSRGTYAAYTYAKQTLGCREYDDVAAVCVGPVMAASATIMEKLEVPFDDNKDTGTIDVETKEDEDVADDDANEGEAENEDDEDLAEPVQERRPDPKPSKQRRRKRDLVLDDREPHLVKYDVTRKERQKLDMHTDKSEWTFLISLSEGCGADYKGGGTYFECIDSTVHLSKGQALIFPGKLRHRGQKITAGHRFLLVGFLVDKNEEKKKASAPKRAATSAPVQVRGAPLPLS